jgi:hypothetical protein
MRLRFKHKFTTDLLHKCAEDEVKYEIWTRELLDYSLSVSLSLSLSLSLSVIDSSKIINIKCIMF